MSLFDKLVSEALKGQADLAPLRSVVKKELLHHDILREMSKAGLPAGLTFIGGTCLRMAYGSNRLSEDLDFTGGDALSSETLKSLGDVLVERLKAKYDLDVDVSKPVRQTGNTSTWRVAVTTHPTQTSMPRQRIHIEICAIPSYQKRPVVLRNHYGVEMGTSGLIIQAQSAAEILADKVVAFALRPNRIKNRDLWDIAWLKQQNTDLPNELVAKKINDHRQSVGEFLKMIGQRNQQLEDSDIRNGFIQEMRRFLAPNVISRTVEKEEFWMYLRNLIDAQCKEITNFLKGAAAASGSFQM